MVFSKTPLNKIFKKIVCFFVHFYIYFLRDFLIKNCEGEKAGKLWTKKILIYNEKQDEKQSPD